MSVEQPSAKGKNTISILLWLVSCIHEYCIVLYISMGMGKKQWDGGMSREWERGLGNGTEDWGIGTGD